MQQKQLTTGRVAILVSSFDGYEDLWAPFFTLFFRFWPDCPFPLYLISNYKTFSSLCVSTLQVGKDRGWASNLLTALKKISEDYVLCLEEDYLLCGTVDTDRIHSLISYVIRCGAGYLRLYPVPGPTRPAPDNLDVGIIDKGAAYRTSLQAAAWKKSVLKMIVREGETAWDFEYLGSIRSNALDCPFLCVTRYESVDGDVNGLTNLPLPYYATAIIKGRWLPGAVGLCRREGISIDLAYRRVWSKFWLHPIGHVIQLWIGRIRQVFKIVGFIKTPDSHTAFRNVLPSYIDFAIPGFEKSYPRGIFKCLSFSNQPSGEWFLSFLNEVEDAIGKRFLPIYRMSDGEFQFCVGYHYPHRATDEPMWLYVLRTLWRVIRRLHLRLLKKRFTGGGRSYISGDYLYTELEPLRIRYAEQLKQITQQGFLALHFTDRVSSRERKQFQQQYIAPVFRWLDRKGIKLHEGNYCPFYFVYAMLTGPFRHRIYQDRRVLVITSYDHTKYDAIANGLEREGVANTQFLLISQGRSMYDTIDLSLVKPPIDLVLVGGGIGASNILCQLGPLRTVAIDAGYVIECLADPERKKQRTFCWSDEERNGDYRAI